VLIGCGGRQLDVAGCYQVLRDAGAYRTVTVAPSNGQIQRARRYAEQKGVDRGRSGLDAGWRRFAPSTWVKLRRRRVAGGSGLGGVPVLSRRWRRPRERLRRSRRGVHLGDDYGALRCVTGEVF